MGLCKEHYIALLVNLVLTSCADDSEMTQSTESIMGTAITVTALAEAHNIVFDIFHDVDNKLSEWKQDALLSKVNNAAGKMPVEVPDDLFAAIQRSLTIAELTSGAFDPTWAALWEIWKFDGTNIVPTDSQLQQRLALVDWKAVTLDAEKGTIYLPYEGMMLGLGGVAKGVALDRARNALIQHGIRDFMIVAGGQVLVHGLNDGTPWRIGIRTPGEPQSEFMAVLEVSDLCVATSGDYEKFFEVDGVRYHHIIDPKTGKPARGVRSVTVISPDATLADALSTALFVMGPEKGMLCVNAIPSAEALFIDTNNQLLFSTNCKKLLRNSDSVPRF